MDPKQLLRPRILGAIASGLGLASACSAEEGLSTDMDTGSGQISITPSDEEVAAAFLENGCCGRAFRVAGAARVAAPVAGAAWNAAAVIACPPCPSAGEEWLRDALYEHASVASFSSFALTLLSVGAPPALLAACAVAARDEVLHAELCFALASYHLGRRVAPGSLPLGQLDVETDLSAAALSTFVDGCIGESIAALTARAQSEVAQDAFTRQALQRIAEDETRHAELAFQFVAWAAVRAGAPLLSKLEQALQASVANYRDETPSAADEDAWHCAGRLTRVEREAIAKDVLHTLVVPAFTGLRQRLGVESNVSRTASPTRRASGIAV